LEIEVVEAPEGLVVRLSGEAGVPDAAALEAATTGLAARRPAQVTFELSELRAISCLALGILEQYRRAAVRTGARVLLAAQLHPAVREALTRTELLSHFGTAGDAEPGAGAAPSAEGARKWYPSVDDVQRMHRLAWGQLVELEPQVETLLWRARTAGAGCRCLTDVTRAFSPLRNELADLIGFAGKHNRHPVLGSIGAYEVAYWKLYDAVAAPLPVRSRATAGREHPACEAAHGKQYVPSLEGLKVREG
jgi:anti-anti-sigma regulatory factor